MSVFSKREKTTEQTLTPYGYVSDEQLSSTLRIIDRLPLSEWWPDDEWRRMEALGFLRELSSDADRTLSDSEKACLQRILKKLPPPDDKEISPSIRQLNRWMMRSVNEDVCPNRSSSLKE